MCLFDIRVLLMDAFRADIPREGKNAHFRLRQQARALGRDCQASSATTLSWCVLARAKPQKCVRLRQACDACKPPDISEPTDAFEVVGEAALILKRRLTLAGRAPNFAEPGKRW